MNPGFVVQAVSLPPTNYQFVLEEEANWDTCRCRLRLPSPLFRRERRKFSPRLFAGVRHVKSVPRSFRVLSEEYIARPFSNLRVDLPVDCKRSRRANQPRSKSRAANSPERLHVASALLRWWHVVPADALEDATNLHRQSRWQRRPALLDGRDGQVCRFQAPCVVSKRSDAAKLQALRVPSVGRGDFHRGIAAARLVHPTRRTAGHLDGH